MDAWMHQINVYKLRDNDSFLMITFNVASPASYTLYFMETYIHMDVLR